MKILSSFALVYQLILILGVTTIHSTAIPVDYSYAFDFDTFNGICPVEKLLPPLPKCIDPFSQEIRKYSTRHAVEKNGCTKLIYAAVSESIFCCAVKELKHCLFNEIGLICGTYAEERAELIVNILVHAGEYAYKQLVNHSSCDTWYYESASPICWEHKTLVKIVILLPIILLISCCFYCVCCRKICCFCCPSPYLNRNRHCHRL